MLEVPPDLWPKRHREVYTGFRLIEGPSRSITIKRMYMQAYGNKLVARAELLVTELASIPVTTLQLKRFFAMYDSASKAKDAQREVLVPETRNEIEWDVSRVLHCTDTLQQALERILQILPCEMNIIPRMRAIKDSYVDLLAYMKFQCRLSSRDGHARTLHVCRETYSVLRELAVMQAATWIIQRKYRKYRQYKTEYLTRHNAAAERIYRQYLQEKNTDYVRLEWEADRKKEQAAMEAALKEERLQQEKARIEHELRAVLPYGWEKVWRDPEQRNQEEGKFVYRSMDKRGKVKEQEDRPTYTFEDDNAVRLIQSAMRVFRAKQILKRLKRAHK